MQTMKPFDVSDNSDSLAKELQEAIALLPYSIGK
jgi:hypothetical protein